MNCKDFRELADSYLSDELAVETNHQVFKHLENCEDCRAELSSRREVREKLRISLKNAPEFQIDPAFAARLRTNLQEESSKSNAWLPWKVFIPVFASLLIVATIGLMVIYQKTDDRVPLTARDEKAFQQYIVEMSHDAIGDHEHCALEKLKQWEANAGKVKPEQATFVKTLQTSDTEVLATHDCEYDGKIFTHYILRRDGKIISVAKIASKYKSAANIKSNNSIISEQENGIQVASFQDGNDLVFVISEMSETENLTMARNLSDSLKL